MLKRTNRFRRMVAAAPLAALALMAAEAPVAAQDPVDQGAQYRVSSEEALMADAAAFALDYDMSVEDAAKAVVAQDLYAIWLTRVVDTTPTFSTSQLDLASMTAKVWFTRLPESLDIPDLGGLQVELLSGAVMTRADAASRSLEVQTALNAAGVHDFTASIDERTGITNVLVNPDPLSISDVLGRLPVHLVTDPKLIFELH